MSYTLEQIDQLTKKSVQRERSLVAEYKRTHSVPSRGIISTQNRLYGEYCKLIANRKG